MQARTYYNLNKRLLSVQNLCDRAWRSVWRVCEHTHCVALANATFKVSEAGRQRVLKERRKNVHAFIQGERIAEWELPPKVKTKRVFYNPYKAGHFVDADGNKIEKADFVLVRGDKGGYAIFINE